MATVSALLRSAETRARRLRELEDSQIAFDWQQSAKTYEDFQAYSGYLESRLVGTADPAQQLGYQKSIASARSGYISNEIQRGSIDVIEGRGTNIDKYNRMLDLYYMARDHNQYDLATSMHLQLDRLSVTIQNEADATARARSAGTKANTDYIDQYKEASGSYQDAIDQFVELYHTSKPQDFQGALNEYLKTLKMPAGTDLFGVVTHLASSAISILEEGVMNSPNVATRARLESAYNTLAKGNIVSLPTAGKGNISLSYRDLAESVGLAQYGQYPLTSRLTTQFNPETGRLETVNTFAEQPQTGFAYGRDTSGNPVLIPTYGAIKDDFKISGVMRNKADVNYEVLLKEAGFDVVAQDGSLIVTPNTNSPVGFSVPGQAVQAFVGPDGKLQFIGGDGRLYNFNFDLQSGKFINVRESAPNPIVLFNERTALPFLSTLDPDALPANAIGILGPDARGRIGQPATNILQRAASVQFARAAEQLQKSANTQGGANAPGLTNAPASARLTIAQPAPGPRLQIAKAPPLPKLTLAPPKPQPKLELAKPQSPGGLQLGSGPRLQ